LVKAMGASDAADARVEALPDPAANALNVAAAPDGEENLSARRLLSRAKAGVWQRHPAERGPLWSSGAHVNISIPQMRPPSAAVERSNETMADQDGVAIVR